MNILAVETATEACSASLFVNGEVLEKFQLAPRVHSQLILPMIDALMAEAELKVGQLDALAFGRGPGSFTGVRIATGIIHGIALGADLPVMPVSTLAALAQACVIQYQANTVFTAMDARMDEIYWAEYSKNDSGMVQLRGLESVINASEITFSGRQGVGVGSAWAVHAEQLQKRLASCVLSYDASYLPRASNIALLASVDFTQGRAVPVEQAMPVYLRDKVAKKQSER